MEKGPTEVDCISLSYMAVGRLSVVELTFFSFCACAQQVLCALDCNPQHQVSSSTLWIFWRCSWERDQTRGGEFLLLLLHDGNCCNICCKLLRSRHSLHCITIIIIIIIICPLWSFFSLLNGLVVFLLRNSNAMGGDGDESRLLQKR